MAYEAGSVASFTALLAALRTFLTGAPGTPGRDWTEQLYQVSKNYNGTVEPYADLHEIILSNTGTSGTDSVIIGIREYKYLAFPAWGWDLNCYLTYSAGELWNGNSALHGLSTYDASWQRYTRHPQLPLMDGSMYYWFFSNKNRVIVVVRTSSQYQSMYLGNGLRLGTPTEYPYPLCAIGSLCTNLNYADQTTSPGRQHSFFADPYINVTNVSCPMVVSPAGVYSTTLAAYGSLEINPSSANWNWATYMPGRGMDGRIMMFPVYVMMENNLLFAFEGVRHVPFPGIASEDIIVQGGTQWLAFQNCWLTAFYNFIAIDTEQATTYSTTTTTTTTTA